MIKNEYSAHGKEEREREREREGGGGEGYTLGESHKGNSLP